MAYIYLVPQWFFGFDIAMELLFAIIALILAAFAYKIYKASEHKEVKLFGVSFLLISLSYFVWAWTNSFLLEHLTSEVLEISLNSLLSTNYILSLTHMGLFMAGLITLAYATLEIETARGYYLLLGLGLIGLVSSSIPWITYQIISIFVLSAIVYHYIIDHMCYKNNKARYVFLAFILLLGSRIDFLFTLRSTSAYIFGHILELGAYLLILVSLLSSIKNLRTIKNLKRN